MNRVTDLNSILAEEFAVRAEKPFTPGWLKQALGRKLRIHLVGLGDVGRTVAVGLRVLGKDTLETIGIYDLNGAQAARLEMELNQISMPCGRESLPKVIILEESDLFACDIFLYCATKSVPAVGSDSGDVRMAQYEANSKIAGIYAQKAAEKPFPGLFGVVSDPVDLLCMAVLRASASGKYPLHPEQIQGFGLGVMFGRAAYYAEKAAQAGESGAAWFPSEGRVFGPHGKDLVAANSIKTGHYDGQLSEALTDRTVHANLEMRSLGFKPYIAPAFSSAAYSVLAAAEGQWCDSARYLNGLYFGSRSRMTEKGCQWEEPELPPELFERVAHAYRSLEAVLCI